MFSDQQFDQYMREVDARIADLEKRYGIYLSKNDTKPTAAVDPETKRNIQIAGIFNKATDQEVLDTMLGFMDGSISIESLPYATAEARINNNIDLKQAGLRNQDDYYTKLQTFMEFGALV